MNYPERRAQSWKQRHPSHAVKVHTCPLCNPSAPFAAKFRPLEDEEEARDDGNTA